MGIRTFASCVEKEAHKTIGEIENLLKGNPRNSESTITLCLYYSIVPLDTIKLNPGSKFQFYIFHCGHSPLSVCIYMYVCMCVYKAHCGMGYII